MVAESSADPLNVSVAGPGSGGHLAAVDVVRFLTVAGVILVHATALVISYGSVAAGAVYQLAHVTRSVFLLLSAFVLTYSARRRPRGPVAFWRRRFPLVVVPYATWSLIYVLTDGDLRSPSHVVGKFLQDLLTGGAHFHLYFLLLTMQLYAIFPAVEFVLAHRPRVLRPALLAALVLDLLVCGVLHYGSAPSFARVWLDHANTWLLTYPAFVVAGIAAGLRFSEVTAWILGHYRLVAGAWLASVALALASYLLDMSRLGYPPLKASEVFQPIVVVEALTATAAQYALGLWVTQRLSSRRLRGLERSSDVSFGVYLAHPLLIGGILDVAVASGLWRRLSGLPSGAGEALVAFALVPFVYAVTFVLVTLARRTPLSLALTGRRRSPSSPS